MPLSKTEPEPFPDQTLAKQEESLTLPVATEHSVTVGFGRKITDGDYGAGECSFFETFKFAEQLTPTQVDLLRANVMAKQKAQVFAELGLKAELNEDGMLMEIAKVFPGAKPAGRTAAPAAPQRTAPSRAVAPPEYDDQFTEADMRENNPPPRRAPADPTERDWRDFMDDPSGFFDDLNAEKPRIKRKGQNTEPCWLNVAPQWVKDWATENGIAIPAAPRGGGGGGRTGGGGGYRR